MVNHLVYDAFGKVTAETDPAVDSLFLFTARPFDAETKQVENSPQKVFGQQLTPKNLNRWYDASVGRWLSEDPIGFDACDGNLYRYVGNCGLLRRDPWGLIGMPWDTDSPSQLLWHALRTGQWDVARDLVDDILKYAPDPKLRS